MTTDELSAARDLAAHDPTSHSLLDRLRSNEADAWEQFVRLYGPLIYTWCRRAGCRPSDAADLLQQIFIKVWAGIGNFEKRTADQSFRAWLAVITRHAVFDFARRCRSNVDGVGGTEALQNLHDLPAALENSTALLASDLRSLALRAVDYVHSELPTEAARIFELTILQEKSAVEVATLVNSTPAAVRKAKSRLLRRLREALGEV